MLFVAALWLLAAPARAVDVIAVQSQDRSVSVSALVVDNGIPDSDQDADSLAAPDAGPFDALTNANASIANAVASSSASQTSEILGSSIHASGSISASADSYDYEAQGQSQAASRCEVTFELAGPSAFTLNGDLTGFGSGAASVTLEGTSGIVVSVGAGSNQSTPVLETGDLDPDTYVLSVNATGSAFASFFVFFGSSASYDLSFDLEAVTAASDVAGVGAAPEVSPNPFRDACTIRYGAPDPGGVEVSVFDVRGRLVRNLSGEGRRTFVWDGRNASGEVARPGVYFVRVTDSAEARSLKIVRLR
jgi:hypothetical protein